SERKPILEALYGTGTFRITYEPPVSRGTDTALPRLTTGKLELEVKAPAPKPKKKEQQKEDFTAWGEEVGGLRAGLGLKAGAKRVYRHGETVTLFVRVRNVGKEAVKFEY